MHIYLRVVDMLDSTWQEAYVTTSVIYGRISGQLALKGSTITLRTITNSSTLQARSLAFCHVLEALTEVVVTARPKITYKVRPAPCKGYPYDHRRLQKERRTTIKTPRLRDPKDWQDQPSLTCMLTLKSEMRSVCCKTRRNTLRATRRTGCEIQPLLAMPLA